MIDITDKTFEQETKDGLVIVDFWAEWCGPCRIQTPILEELENELDGKLKVTKLNVDENQTVPQEFGIMSIPTLLIKKDGQTVEKLVGVRTKEMLMETLQAHM